MPDDFVLAHLKVVVFHDVWGRTAAAGFVAEEEGEPLGAVWYRLFTEAEHGDGFVDAETPELAIAVVAGRARPSRARPWCGDGPRAAIPFARRG